MASNSDSDSSDLDKFICNGIKKFKNNYTQKNTSDVDSDDPLLNEGTQKKVTRSSSKLTIKDIDSDNPVQCNDSKKDEVVQHSSDNNKSAIHATSTELLNARLDKLIHECNVIASTSKKKRCRKKAPSKRQANTTNTNIYEVSTDDEILEVKEDINPIVSIKILWKSIEYKVFKVKKFDKLQVILDYFVNKCNIDEKLLLFTIDDKEVDLKCNTSMSLQLKENQIIEGGILPEEYLTRTVIDNTKNTNGIKFKVQCINNKTFHIVIRPEDNMDILYSQVIKETDLSIDKFKILFDGVIVKHADTIDSLGLEEGDLFDVTLL